MIYKEEDLKKSAILQSISLVTAAIRTAPKAIGLNPIAILVLTEEDKDRLADKMATYEKHPFPRDSRNVKDADAIILVGAKTLYIRLDCGLCGYPDCKTSENNGGPCIFNTIDLGIALGSAVSTLADLKIDNRIMYTPGIAAIDMGLFPKEYNIVMGIPLKIESKNIFFDRK